MWFMVCLNLTHPVLIRLRRTSECRLRSCPTGFFGGIGIHSLSLQGVASHLLDQALFVHVVLFFPKASIMIHLAYSEKVCRDRRCFRPDAVVATMVCNLCWWSSASARRASASHCLFRRMYGGVIPVTSVSIGCTRTPAGGCYLVLRQFGACGYCGTTLRHHTAAPHCGTTLANTIRPEQKQVRLSIFQERQSVLRILCRRSKLHRALTFFESWDRCFE